MKVDILHDLLTKYHINNHMHWVKITFNHRLPVTLSRPLRNISSYIKYTLA